MKDNSIPHPLLSEFHHEMDESISTFPEDMTVFIPTYGRVGEQLTIKSFPEETWGVNVFLVAPEHEDHGDLPVITHPPEIDSIAKKRHWIMEYARDHGMCKIAVSDDNMTIKVRKYDKPEECTLVPWQTKGEFYSPWHFLSNRLEHIHIAQLKSRFFGQTAAQMTMVGAGGGSFYAYRVDTYFDLNIDTSDLPIYEDVHILLEYAKAGHGFLLFGDLIVEKKLFKHGGNRKVPSYSEAEAYVQALHDFTDIHSDWVKVIEMKNPYNNRPTNHACQFNWRKMRKYLAKLNEPEVPSVFDLV